jgi:hypothetical protein
MPEKWRIAQIMNTNKKVKTKKTYNYRGTALLNSAYNAHTTLIKSTDTVESILQKEQCGFHKCTSFIDAVFTLKQTLEEQYLYANTSKVKLSRYTPWRHMGGEEV